METLLRRQYDLIACLGGNADGSQSQQPVLGRGSKGARAAGGLAAAGAGTGPTREYDRDASTAGGCGLWGAQRRAGDEDDEGARGTSHAAELQG